MIRLSKVVPLIGMLGLVACGTDGPAIDAAGVDLDLRIERLDQALFHAPPDSTRATADRLLAEQGDFFRVYIEEILRLCAIDDPRLPLGITRFTHDPDWVVAQASIDSVLGDLEPQRDLFGSAFERLKAAFPDSLVPRVVAYNSGYNYGVFPTDSVLGVGLEWFIGPQERTIQLLAPENFPEFFKQRMVPDMLVPGAVKGWLLVHYTRDLRGGDLLFNLVETGKVMSLLDALLPEVHDSLLFAFTGAQLEWCGENEFELWREVVDKEMLFSTEPEHIGRLMNDGPFTNGFPRESPGHVGDWIGYRMVRSYLQEHPGTTFAQLFAINDPKEILKSYKPR